MNVIRYNASGITHHRGIGAISVVMWLVTLPSNVEGNTARPTQRTPDMLVFLDFVLDLASYASLYSIY
jgi:hypothetical protein